MIDSLELFEILKIANLTEPQARTITQAIGRAFDNNAVLQAKALATKADTATMEAEVQHVQTSLQQNISGLGIELRSEMKALGVELRAEMNALGAELRAEMRALEARLEARIAASQTSMIRWMFVLWIGQIAAWKFLR